MRVHRDEMVERKDRQRDPDRRRRRGADLEYGEADDAERKQDLQVDEVAARELDLAVDPLAKVDERAGGVGILREELGLFLDLARELVDLRRGGLVVMRLPDMLMEAAVEFVVLVGVVVQYHAPGGRIDGDVLDAGDHPEGVADLPQELRIALGRRNLQANPPRHLMRDAEL